MQAFKTALGVCLRHPVYLIVYVGLLSLMGLFMGQSLVAAPDEGEFSAARIPFTVVDRDDSRLSRAIGEFLAARGEWVEVADEQRALQDAVATGQMDYLLIVPEGFEEDFMAAARGSGVAPQLESVFSFQSSSAMLADTQVNQYLRLVGVTAALDLGASAAQAIASANEAAQESASVQVVNPPQLAVGADAFLFYLMWGSYPLTAAIVVSVGLLMGAFSRVDVRRRVLVSPVSALSLGMQKVAAGFVVTVAVWAFIIGLGLAAFRGSAACLPPGALALALIATFLYALTPLAIAFLLGQLGASEMVSNAVGNIVGMVFTFLGGAWVSTSLLPAGVQAVASFTPVYWLTNVLSSCSEAGGATDALWASALPSLGVLALFAVAIFVAALVGGRLRLQSSQAGGNAAAARSR
ncbi:ABC transporter permease [Parvibacter caecicola]|uniref:ABC transporter permease n=1 Tax=Parvibacter caecicola TaxID=747645 RepID=UPI00249C0A93|nr:ABC transporter permease [Parvibacter caecicola]